MTYSEDKTAMAKDKKFQYKWIFDENLAYCKETRIWCLIYIDGKGILWNLCRLTNTMIQLMHPKLGTANQIFDYRAETVKDHFKKDANKQTMHKDAVMT